jgi:hypothetical protein
VTGVTKFAICWELWRLSLGPGPALFLPLRALCFLTIVVPSFSLDPGWRFSDTIVDEKGVLLAQVFLDKGICESASREATRLR